MYKNNLLCLFSKDISVYIYSYLLKNSSYTLHKILVVIESKYKIKLNLVSHSGKYATT